MKSVLEEESTKEHIERVNRLHAVFEDGLITRDDALNASVELLGLVLINSFDDKEEMVAELNELLKGLTMFMNANWEDAQAARAQRHPSRIN